MADHDIFISYARADDQPRGAGKVTAFYNRLKARHRAYRGRELEIFFDTDAIENGADWETRIGSALKSSKLFLALLSPNALNSEWCRREWEEYLRLEHTLARGDDGVETLFLADVPGLLDGAPESFDASKRAWIEDIRRRNLHHAFDLRAWGDAGPEQLGLIDAEDRLAELRAHPRDDSAGHLIKLEEQIAAIDRAIAKRLDRATLAEFAPGHLPNSYCQFVGRNREMRDLHRALCADKVGLVGALHGLGGQGKTALAVQYAYAYAEQYAAGGRWQLGCEGKATLFSALAPLAALLEIEEPRQLALESDSAFEARFLRTLVEAIERRMAEVAPRLAQWLASSPKAHARPEDQPEVERAALLILENVDRPALLSATQMAWLARRPWLHVIVTTRLDPEDFGGLAGAVTPIAVDDLPADDAFALLGKLWPIVGEREADAARQVVARLGGFTLGIELVGAYLAASRTISYAGFLDRLAAEGLTAVDTVGADAKTANRLRYEHRQKQIGAILADTIAGLSEAARETLAFAALFPPDAIVPDWLRALAANARPELDEDQVKPGYPDPFAALLADLAGRRLLPKGAATEGHVPLLRMHRLVGEYVARQEHPERVEARWTAMLALVDALQRHVEQNWYRAPQEILPLLTPFGALAEHAHRARASAVTAKAICVLADCELQLGRFLRAGELQEAALATFRQLSEASPGDADAARVLSVSLNKMGDFHLRRGGPGDADRALAAYEESLATFRRLSEASPGDARAARDLSASLEKLGDFHLRRGGPGDADRALEAYEEDLQIARRLSEASPGDAEAARDLSVSLNRMGDFHLRRGGPGDADRALEAYEESLATRRQLSEASPGDAEAALDLSLSLNKMGDFHLRRGGPGDADRALAAYEDAVKIARRLCEASPGDARAARDLFVHHFKIARLREALGDADAERAADEAAFALAEDFVRNGRIMDEDMRETHAWLKQKLRAPRGAGSGGKTALLPRLLGAFRSARRHLGIF